MRAKLDKMQFAFTGRTSVSLQAALWAGLKESTGGNITCLTYSPRSIPNGQDNLPSAIRFLRGGCDAAEDILA
jgi:hypothetical protein